MPHPPHSVLLLGLGNDILTDDAIGLTIVRRLRDTFSPDDGIDVRETQEMGLALLDFLSGYRDVVLVDAIQTGKAPPGTIHELDVEGLPSLAARTPHFLGVGETLALGRSLGLPMPARVRVIAVEVADPFTLGTRLTPELERALPRLVQHVAETLRSHMAASKAT